jgi:hypothetical protein
MPEMFAGSEPAKEMIIATIANQKNPAQVVEIVHLPEEGIFTTRGVGIHFQLKEIAVPQVLMLAEMQEYTGVLSYILERIATAADLQLPFRYEPEFALGDSIFSLEDSGDYLILTRND